MAGVWKASAEAADSNSAKAHRLTVDGRRSLSATGVLDVVSFDEEKVVAETGQGTLIVKGAGLHVRGVNLDIGQLDVDGSIDGIYYGSSGKSARGGGTLLGRICR